MILTDGNGNPIAEVTADGSGNWTYTPSTPIANGTVVNVVAEDAAGNSSPPATVTVDSSAPPAPVINPSNGVVISGTAEAGATVTLTDAGGNPIGQVTADGSGNWSFTPGTPLARHQARLVECAGIQGGAKAFWSAIDAIFAQSVGNGGELAGGTLDFPELDQSRLEKCAKDNGLIDSDIKLDIDIARSKGITATPTLVIRDNQTGRSVKLEGMADETTLLSAIDWLAKDH